MTYATLYSPYCFPYPSQKDCAPQNGDLSLEQLMAMDHISSGFGQRRPTRVEDSVSYSGTFTKESEQECRPISSLWPTTPYEITSSSNSVPDSLYENIKVKVEEGEIMACPSPSIHLGEGEFLHFVRTNQALRKNEQQDILWGQVQFDGNKDLNSESGGSFDSSSSSRSSPEPYHYNETLLQRSFQPKYSPVQSTFSTESDNFARRSNEEYAKPSTTPAWSEDQEYILSPGVSNFTDLVCPSEIATLYEATYLNHEKDNICSPSLADIDGISQLIEYPLHMFEKSSCDQQYMMNASERDYFEAFDLQAAEQLYMHPDRVSPNMPYQVSYSKLNGACSRKKRANPPTSMMTTFNSRMISASAKKYHCTICQKGFSRPSSLNTHMYSHTGEKPFKCPHEGCGRHFSVVSNLRRHTKIHSCKFN
ncbi:hypothetical protein K7432_010221 [Basidiobolus ranarum]|uniref:C2H2-type domain-containing protein n=1 Tax=Basidiobolus ranarum TaxID=34480 RepID=A0ABR2WP38_9FUNG